MGRKKIVINWPVLEALAMYDAPAVVCAEEMNISIDTLERAIRRKYKKTFSEYKLTHCSQMGLRLKQKIIKKALQGDNACLFMGVKNMSDWRNNPEDMAKDDVQVVVKSNKTTEKKNEN